MTRASEGFGVPTDKDEDEGLVPSPSSNSDDLEVTMEDIYELLGRDAQEFISCMVIVQSLIDDPRGYLGPAALVEAARLAALRTKIGVKVQHYKTAAKSVTQRKRKDQLYAMYHSLEENINTLKKLGDVNV